jgi:hypothetical protein
VARKAKLGYDTCLLRWVEIHTNIHKENRQKVIMVIIEKDQIQRKYNRKGSN